MAERSNATAKKTQEPTDVGALQKRGRRRLVGAIALVLLAVIVLPMVFDPEPRQNTPLVNIRIPSEEGSKFTPKVVPRGNLPAQETVEPKNADSKPAATDAAPAAKSVTPAVVATATPAPTTAAPKLEPKPEPKPEPKARPEPKIEPRPEAKPAAKTESRQPAGEKIIYQVGAFASSEKVKEVVEQLQAEKLPHYTETVATAKGTVTRVRLGPFTSKSAADKALGHARALGMNPVNVVPK